MSQIRNAAWLLAGFIPALFVTWVTGASTAPANWVNRSLEKAAIVPVGGLDSALTEELNALRYPQTRPLLRALVMDQVVEDARLARFEMLRAAGSEGWQVPLPTVARADDDLPPRLALGDLPGDGSPPELLDPQPQGQAHLVSTTGALLALVAGLLIVMLRRRH